MRLILIRHGQTPSNVEHSLDTAVPGPGLTELGLAQAAALPEALAGEPVDGIYASNMVRTQLTADPLAASLGLPVEVRAGLREISAGSLEMRRDREAVEDYLKTVYSWVRGDLDVHMPGGPDGHETLDRFDAVVAELAGLGLESPVIVSHGAMIRTWATLRARNVGSDFIVRNGLSNTGIAVLESGGRSGEWDLLTWMGEPVGGEDLQDRGDDGPVAEDVIF